MMAIKNMFFRILFYHMLQCSEAKTVHRVAQCLKMLLSKFDMIVVLLDALRLKRRFQNLCFCFRPNRLASPFKFELSNNLSKKAYSKSKKFL